MRILVLLGLLLPSALTLPFRWTPGQIEVQASLDGRPPVWCIVDSGAEFSMLDREVAKTLGFGTRVENVPVRIGTVTLPRQDFRLWALDNFRRQKRDIRGVIGCELFERYVVTIDYRQRLITLQEPATYRPPASARPVPITFAGRLPVIRTTLTVRGKRIPARLMIDTGASQAVILRHPFSTANHLFGDQDKTTTSETVATGGRSFITIAVDQLDLDRWAFRSPKTSAYGTPAGAGGGTDSDGLLGNDILQHFRVTFDYSRKRILLDAYAPAPVSPLK